MRHVERGREGTCRDRSPPPLREQKAPVPEVTLAFWVIKVLCTTVGETAADLLNDKLGLGLTMTTYIMGIFLAVLLAPSSACAVMSRRCTGRWSSCSASSAP
jgi:uncharacterized membrane-anchored protein